MPQQQPNTPSEQASPDTTGSPLPPVEESDDLASLQDAGAPRPPAAGSTQPQPGATGGASLQLSPGSPQPQSRVNSGPPAQPQKPPGSPQPPQTGSTQPTSPPAPQADQRPASGPAELLHKVRSLRDKDHVALMAGSLRNAVGNDVAKKLGVKDTVPDGRFVKVNVGKLRKAVG